MVWKKIASSTAGDQRVADAAEDRVVRPDHQSVLAVAAQEPAVMKEVAVEESGVADSQRSRGFRIHAEPARLDVLEGDRGHGSGMAAVLVEEERGMEDLEGAVGIESRVDPGDGLEIAIEKLGKTNGVVYGPSSRAARDEKLEARDGEGVLHVHEQESHRRPVRRPLRTMRCRSAETSRASRARS